jgi:EAL domain-containing protein (putative c-di-GMP-specific phosphodiesterase class I)
MKILGVADSLRLDVVAERVEPAIQLAELRRLGVRLAQGYLWSRPLPAERIAVWLEAHPTGFLPGTEQRPELPRIAS